MEKTNAVNAVIEMFPLIKLAKKLKVLNKPLGLLYVQPQKFPLIKLAKKLKDAETGEVLATFTFPLIKLAKKLKEGREKDAGITKQKWVSIN